MGSNPTLSAENSAPMVELVDTQDLKSCALRAYEFESRWGYINAELAELVDALVSNTSDESRVGSSPTLGTRRRIKWKMIKNIAW